MTSESRRDDAAAAMPTHWDALPLALSDRAKLRTVTSAAARSGVRTGMTVAQGKSKCAALQTGGAGAR